jgi:hypothetical protein
MPTKHHRQQKQRRRRQPEEWRDINSYEGMYQISSWGRVKSCARIVPGRSRYGSVRMMPIAKRILKPSLIEGLKVVLLARSGTKSRTKSVAHLVAQHFLPPHPLAYQVRFKDGNHANVYFENLEWRCRRPPKEPVLSREEIAYLNATVNAPSMTPLIARPGRSMLDEVFADGS